MNERIRRPFVEGQLGIRKGLRKGLRNYAKTHRTCN